MKLSSKAKRRLNTLIEYMEKLKAENVKPNGQFKIERGVPIPPSSSPRTGASDALRRLKVGESLVLPASSNSCGSIIRQVQLSKRFPTKAVFTSRKIDGDHTRVWRIK